MADTRLKVSIHIVTWNSLKFLPDCLASIFNQTYQSFSVLVIDNASNDGTIEFIKDNYPQVKIFRNNKNLGFAAAHNQGIKIAILNQKYLASRYILVINPDIILSPDFLEKIIPIAEKDKEIGALTGKNMKVYTSEPEINEKVKTEIIDSTGSKIFKSRQVVDRGENEMDQGQYNQQEEVFGVSGACALYRLVALEDIRIPTNYEKFTKIRKNNLASISLDESNDSYIRNGFATAGAGSRCGGIIRSRASEASGEYLDEDFFAYKEDIDLSYRLRWRGWKIVYCPGAVVYHHRQIFGGKLNVNEVIKRRRNRSPLIKYLSYRNHLLLLVKNESFINFLKDLPWILFYELKKFLYILFFEQKTLKAIPEFFAKAPKMLQKKSWIMKNKKISSREIRKWFF